MLSVCQRDKLHLPLMKHPLNDELIQLFMKLTYILNLNWMDRAGNYSKLNYKILIKDIIVLIVLKLISLFKLNTFIEKLHTWDESKEIFNNCNDNFTYKVIKTCINI